MAKQDGRRKIIRANAFVLEDDDGRTRAELAMGEHGPGFHLYDEKGNIRGVLEMNAAQSRLTLYNPEGNGFAGLHVTDDGKPKLFMYDKGEIRAELVAEEHLSALSLHDEKGELRAVLAAPSPTVKETGEVVAGRFLSVVESGEASLCLYSDKGKACVQLIVTDDGPAVVLNDDKGSSRASLRVTQDGRPALLLRDSKGNIRAWLAVTDDGPTLELFDEREAPCVALATSDEGSTMRVTNGRQKVRAELRVSKGEPVLELRDETCPFPRASLRVSDEAPQLALLDKEGKARAWLLVDEKGKPKICPA
jgi:hypothetical protein